MELPTSAAAKKAADDATFSRIAELSDEVRRPLPGSRKVYVTGSQPDIRVANATERSEPLDGGRASTQSPSLS